MGVPLTSASEETIRAWHNQNFRVVGYLFDKRVIYDNVADWQFGCTSGSSVIGSGTFDLRPSTRTRETAKEWIAPDGTLRSPEWTGTGVTGAGYTDAGMGTANPAPTFGGALGTSNSASFDNGEIVASSAAGGTWTSPYLDTLMEPRLGSVPIPWSWFHFDAYTSKLYTRLGALQSTVAMYLPFEGSTQELREQGASASGLGLVEMVGSGTRSGTGAYGSAQGAAGTMDSRGTGCVRIRYPHFLGSTGSAIGGAIYVQSGAFNPSTGAMSVWLNDRAADIAYAASHLELELFRRSGSSSGGEMWAKLIRDPSDPGDRIEFAAAGSGVAGTLSVNIGTWTGWKNIVIGWGSFGKKVFLGGTLGGSHATWGYPVGSGSARILAGIHRSNPYPPYFVYADDYWTTSSWPFASDAQVGEYEAAGRSLFQLRFGSGTNEASAATFQTVGPSYPSFALDEQVVGTSSAGKRIHQKRIIVFGTELPP